MRRLWLGLGILGILLALSVTVFVAMDRIHAPIAHTLSQAAQAAEQEDWETASALASEARARWEQYRHFTAMVADHTPMDELDGLFQELEVYAQEAENPHFAATAQHLSALAAGMADSQKPCWWNVL